METAQPSPVVPRPRNQAGRFVKQYGSGSALSAMKTITPMSRKKLKRTHLTSSGAPRIGKKTSIVWNFFRALPHENGISRAICVLCKVVFKNPGGSTTGMRGHLERKHPGVIAGGNFSIRPRLKSEPHLGLAHREIKQQQVEESPPPPPLSAENGAVGEVGETEIFEEQESMVELELEVDNPQTATSSTVTLNRSKHILPGPPPEVFTLVETEEVTKHLLLFVVSNLNPLYSVDDTCFKGFVRAINGSFFHRVTSGTENDESLLPTVYSRMDNMYLEMKEEIRRDLHDKPISIALEIWTKTTSELFLLVTATTISQDWRLTSKFLGMRPIPDVLVDSLSSLFSEKISAVLLSLLEEYNVKAAQVQIVFVNCHQLENRPKLQVLSAPTLPCYGETLRRCYDVIDHELDNLTGHNVRDACESFARTSLSNFNDVKYHPGKLVQSLNEFLLQNPEAGSNFDLDSTQVSSFLGVHESVNELVECLLVYKACSGSSVIPMLYSLRQFLEDMVTSENFSVFNNEQRKQICSAVQNFIDEAYDIDLNSNEIGSKPLALCTFLDPRFKKLIFFSEEQKQAVHDAIMELLYVHERKIGTTHNVSIISVRSIADPDYAKTNGIGTEADPLNTSLPDSSTGPASTAATSPVGSSKLFRVLNRVLKRGFVNAPSSSAQEEMDKYLREPVPVLDSDPCQWWSVRCDKYPILSAVARKYLCQVATCVKPEHLFTSIGDKFYGKLRDVEPEYVEKVVCLRVNEGITSLAIEGVRGESQNHETNENEHDTIRVKTEPMDEEL